MVRRKYRKNSNMISVLANLLREWDGSYKPEKICIYKEGKEMVFDAEEWNHLCDVLAGKYNKAASSIPEGCYTPDSISVWSKEWVGGQLT